MFSVVIGSRWLDLAQTVHGWRGVVKAERRVFRIRLTSVLVEADGISELWFNGFA